MANMSMIIYLDIVLQKFLGHMGVTASTPGTEHLFKKHNEKKTQYLPGYQAQTFHHTVAQMVLMSSRA